MSTTNTKNLLDIQIATKSQVDDIHNEDDLIKLSLSVITVHLAKLVPLLVRYSLQKTKPPKTEAIVKELAVVLEYTFILCNSCNFDIPDDKELVEYEESIPVEVRHDSVLTVMGMISAVSDLFHAIYVESELPPWSDENLVVDLHDTVSTIIVGMKHLGIKHNFAPEDVICLFS